MKKFTFLCFAMLFFSWQSYSQDTCSTATPVTPGTITGTTITDATASADMTLPGGDNAAWFVYTATADGTIDVYSCLGGVDTDLGVGTGTCGTLTDIVVNDDSCDIGTGNAWASEVLNYPVIAGNNYYIEWSDEWDAGPFDWTLSFTPLPSCIPATYTVANGANNCPTEAFFVLVDITDLGTAASVNISDDNGLLVAGVGIGSYYIGPYLPSTLVNVTIEDAAGDTCSGQEMITTPSSCPSTNIDCANAEAVTEGTITGTVIEQETLGGQGDTITTRDAAWFAYTATADGTINVGSCLGGADTRLYIFDACGGTEIASGDDDCELSVGGSNYASEVDGLPVTAGSTYYIEWDDRWSAGPFDWTITFSPAPACTMAIIDTSTVVESCNPDGTGTFTVVHVISNAGDAGSILDDGINTYALMEGTITTGPYNSGDSVTINITGVDAECDFPVGTFTYTCTLPAPANDDCVDAEPISCGETVSGSTINATDSGENLSNDVWYVLSGTANGEEITASLCGSDYDSYIRIFDACEGTQIAFNDDASGVCSPQSEVTFTSDGATTYYIMVEGYDSNNGNFDLAITCQPPITCTTAVIGSTTVVDNCSASEFVIDVVISTIGDGTLISDGTNTYPITGSVITTGPYALDENITLTVEHSESACDFTIGTFTDTCVPPAPANDEAAGAIELVVGDTVCDGKVVGTNVGATDSDEGTNTASCSFADPTSDVWYRVTVPSTGEVTIETYVSSGTAIISDSVMLVYTGTPGALTELACSDDDGEGLFSKVELTGLTAGDVLYVRIYSYSNFTKGDFDICAWSPSTLGVDVNTFEGFSYYPNPVAGTLNFKSNTGIENVTVFNMLGQRILQVNKSNIQNVDMSSLQSGAYIVQVSINNQIKSIRVIKE